MNSNPENNRPNVLIVVMDAARARNFSCYGYERKTTPVIDEIASQGVLYEQCISSASWTLPSMSSLFTGLYGSQHGTNFRHQFLERDHATIAEVLSNEGYQTTLFATVEWVSKTFGLARGFEHATSYVGGVPWMRKIFKKTTKIEKLWRLGKWYLLGPKHGKYTYTVSQDVRRWFNTQYQKDKPYFAVMHFGDPHWPWFHHPQHSWIEGKRRPPRLYAPDGHKYMAGELELSEEDSQMMMDFYDGEISFLDHQMGKIFDMMKQGGYLDNTILIILADHGEQLTEHQLIGHGFSVYEDVLHVPFIVHHPEYFSGGERVKEAVQNVDVFPTLIELLNLDKEKIPNHMLGRSLLPEKVRANPRPFTVSERLAPSLKRFRRVVPHFDTTPMERHMRALREVNGNGPGYKLIWGSDGRHELFNLAEDLGENENLAERDPEKLQEMLDKLADWMATFEMADFGELETHIDEALTQRLQELGYL